MEEAFICMKFLMYCLLKCCKAQQDFFGSERQKLTEKDNEGLACYGKQTGVYFLGNLKSPKCFRREVKGYDLLLGRGESASKPGLQDTELLLQEKL